MLRLIFSRQVLIGTIGGMIVGCVLAIALGRFEDLGNYCVRIHLNNHAFFASTLIGLCGGALHRWLVESTRQRMKRSN